MCTQAIYIKQNIIVELMSADNS